MAYSKCGVMFSFLRLLDPYLFVTPFQLIPNVARASQKGIVHFRRSSWFIPIWYVKFDSCLLILLCFIQIGLDKVHYSEAVSTVKVTILSFNRLAECAFDYYHLAKAYPLSFKASFVPFWLEFEASHVFRRKLRSSFIDGSAVEFSLGRTECVECGLG